MRFLVDECTGPGVAAWLRNLNHEVFSVFEEARGMDDDPIIDKAFAEKWIWLISLSLSRKRKLDLHASDLT